MPVEPPLDPPAPFWARARLIDRLQRLCELRRRLDDEICILCDRLEYADGERPANADIHDD